MIRVLVIGQNPSAKPTLNGKTNPTFKRLEEWMSKIGIHYFSFTNTFDEPGVQPKISKVDFKRLCTLCQEYDIIITLGSFVSNVLNKIQVKHFGLPHPSPLNRLLNDKSYEKRVIEQCKEYINESCYNNGTRY